MRILMYLPKFYPSIGGLEIMAEVLADGFFQNGHEVRVITLTRGEGKKKIPYPVHRCPGRVEHLRLVHWSDVFFQRNVSLRGLWPLLLVRRPYVVSHGGWYRHEGVRSPPQEWLKHQVTRLANNVCPSGAIARHLAGPCRVIPNAYRDNVFFPRPSIPVDRDLVFAGRLVSEKGVDVLLAAVGKLQARRLYVTVTIVGEGPEEDGLKRFAESLGVADRVRFTGPLMGDRLAEEYCRHRLMVVPSRCEEGFGTVALEGIACGCVVVGTEGGGLPEAIGPCGVTVPRGDAQAVTETIPKLLSDAALRESLCAKAPGHLADRVPERVVGRYLAVLEEVSHSWHER